MRCVGRHIQFLQAKPSISPKQERRSSKWCVQNARKSTLALKGKAISIQAVEVLRAVRGWGSHVFRHSAYRWRQGYQPYAPAAFTPGNFLVLVSGRGWVDPRAMVRLEGLGQLKKSTSSGTRTGDLPAFNVVPQPTTLPRPPNRFGCNRSKLLTALEESQIEFLLAKKVTSFLSVRY
jgi:hypothetical protein